MSGQLADSTHQKAAEREQRHETLLRLDSVLARTGVRKSQWYALIRDGHAPAPIPLTAASRTRVWIESEVQAFIDQRIQAARAARGAS